MRILRRISHRCRTPWDMFHAQVDFVFVSSEILSDTSIVNVNKKSSQLKK